MTPERAEFIVSRFSQYRDVGLAMDIPELYAEMVAEQGWRAIGYDSWDALMDGRLDGWRLTLPRGQRRETVAEMAAQGMSSRAIAAAVGAGKTTVQRDLATVPNGTVEADHSRQILGQDGRTRTYPPRPKPADDVPRDGIPTRDPAIRDLIATAPDVRAANLRADFAKWLYGINQAHLFDPDELAAIYGEREADVIRTRDALVDWADRYVGTVRRSRMTVLDGGQE